MYMTCRQCKAAIWIGEWCFSGFRFYHGEPDCMEKLRLFLEEHTLHESGENEPPQILFEYSKEYIAIDGDDGNGWRMTEWDGKPKPSLPWEKQP